jgi:hypothetical protein
MALVAHSIDCRTGRVDGKRQGWILPGIRLAAMGTNSRNIIGAAEKFQSAMEDLGEAANLF